MRDTLAGVVSDSRGSRDAVTMTSVGASIESSAAIAAIGINASSKEGMRMRAPIIATEGHGRLSLASVGIDRKTAKAGLFAVILLASGALGAQEAPRDRAQAR